MSFSAFLNCNLGWLITCCSSSVGTQPIAADGDGVLKALKFNAQQMLLYICSDLKVRITEVLVSLSDLSQLIMCCSLSVGPGPVQLMGMVYLEY